jgi:hypothetical protein
LLLYVYFLEQQTANFVVLTGKTTSAAQFYSFVLAELSTYYYSGFVMVRTSHNKSNGNFAFHSADWLCRTSWDERIGNK